MSIYDRTASKLTRPQSHSQSYEDDEATPVPSPAPSEEIGQLARHLSSQQSTGEIFNYAKGSVLDPFGDKFDAKLWINKFANQDERANVQGRKSGISLKDLTVFGHGTDAGKSSVSAQLDVWGQGG